MPGGGGTRILAEQAELARRKRKRKRCVAREGVAFFFSFFKIQTSTYARLFNVHRAGFTLSHSDSSLGCSHPRRPFPPRPFSGATSPRPLLAPALPGSLAASPVRAAAAMSDKEFMWALKNGDLDEVKDYVGKGEDVNRTLEGGRKPLHYAADCGQLEILEFLLLKGADINAPDKHNITPLLSAVYEGHVSCVKLLLSKGADKTVRGPDGLTAFEATDNQAIKALLQ
ncbi:hypothetical protein lerEdw1_018205 [Lerista edwardsae]|nr:hypothetical protein lerEdw1_018205 [Lerista edwardsae]